MRIPLKKRYILLIAISLIVAAGYVYLINADTYRTTSDWSGTFVLQDKDGEDTETVRLDIPNKDGSFPVTLTISSGNKSTVILAHGVSGKRGQLDLLFNEYGEGNLGTSHLFKKNDRLFSLEVTDEPVYVAHWDTFDPNTTESQDLFVSILNYSPALEDSDSSTIIAEDSSHEISETITTDTVETQLRCEPYTELSKIREFLKNNGTSVPIVLPEELLLTPIGLENGEVMYVEYGVTEDGGYNISMSLDNGDEGTYDCQWAQSNYQGAFTASLASLDSFETYKRVSKEVTLVNGATGYFYETGRGRSNIQWFFEGVYYRASDVSQDEADLIAILNSAIEAAE